MAYGIAQIAGGDPTGIAVTDGVTEWTWRQLNTVLNQTVNWLVDTVAPGRRLAVAAANSTHTALAHLAGTYAGLSVVPINHALGVDEMAYLLADSAAEVVLCSARTAATVRAASPTATVVAWDLDADDAPAGVDAFASVVAAYPDTEPSELIAPARPLYYTSGTTGRPRGVELPEQMFPTGGSIVEHVRRFAASRLRPTGRHLVVGPLHHTGPIGGVRGLAAGNPVVILRKFDAEDVLWLIDAKAIGHSVMVPTHFSRLLALPEHTRARYDVSSVQTIVHTGAPCPVHVKRAMIDWFGPVFVDAYGSTEVGTVTVIDSHEWLAHPGSVGKALPGKEITIRNPDGTLCAPGQDGLVCVRSTTGEGPSYRNDPEKTRQSYVADGVFAIGEIGHLDADGYLYLTDRAADMVVSGGVNVYPAESEAVLRAHPGVRDVAVIGIPHSDMGEQLCALVTVADPAPTPEELVSWCRDRLAHYKCPARVEIVDSELRNAMGKINKRQLREEYLTANPSAAAKETS
ncbi:AMP-binding protein [Mycobacterium koreense]|uniref:Uncharacterized protein n=1 Tax=Mycolicibacillus koreensis TaxID=1069220 RepID=A0A7I7SDR4_9MYCO|nr:AMP-binding protein [Mycolicibacillus koreensis]MCV7248003.1 AMP-binding protein [Mycolicibacillus koreensis]OSC31854.1 hypothetical protein B8W67_15700 [Mycolicibacillus koreensis]BBY54938.1 long-chain acyl-CoA synthetase [Mycolicibacillus koreensis]